VEDAYRGHEVSEELQDLSHEVQYARGNNLGFVKSSVSDEILNEIPLPRGTLIRETDPMPHRELMSEFRSQDDALMALVLSYKMEIETKLQQCLPILESDVGPLEEALMKLQALRTKHFST